MRRLPHPTSEILICADPAELAGEAAAHFAEMATRFANDSGKFTVALSGGSTPKAMFHLLAEKPYADILPWGKIHFFWGDERCVPPDHPDSNYRMTNEALLSKVPVPQGNVHRIPAEDKDPDHAATQYSETLRNFFSEEFPRFDLVFLGMGPDGHCASLFPGSTALHVNDRSVVANYVEKFQSWRITMTARTLNRARNVIFLVAGEDKAPALREVLEGPRNPELYPSQLIQPDNGSLLWLVDEAAARLLK
jgi:6-phosphogluconolactonase